MDKSLEHIKLPYLWILSFGILAFLPFLGAVHLFDWDEINFAESAREMLVTGDYMRVRVNFEPFWEKPPLFFWLQALCMKVFGINEFAARLPNALVGIASLLTLFYLGKKQKNQSFGFLWAGMFGISFLPFLYFKSGIIDPLFNLFIFLSIYQLHLNFSRNERTKHAVSGGFFLGLAIITKGPAALVLVLLTFLVYMLSQTVKRVRGSNQEIRNGLRIKDILLFALISFLITSLWFGYEIIQNGPWFLVEFVKYQWELFTTPVAGHQQPLYYHFLVVFLGCFPMSVFGIYGMKNKTKPDSLKSWMLILFWVVMILFTVVKTKIVHYSSMAYLPLSYLAALGALHYFKNKKRHWFSWAYLGLGIVFSALLILAPYLFYQKTLILNNTKDLFAIEALKEDLGFTGLEVLWGIFYLISIGLGFYYLRKFDLKRFLVVKALAIVLVLLGVLKTVVPKIERFSQGPAIDFFKAHSKEDAYLCVFGSKSYAPFFYGETKALEKGSGLERFTLQLLKEYPERDFTARDIDIDYWFMKGTIDKPVYFVVRKDRIGDIEEKFPQLERLYDKGGFVFLKRIPVLLTANE